MNVPHCFSEFYIRRDTAEFYRQDGILKNSMAELGASDEGAGQGGCRCPDLSPDILGGGPVGNVVRVGDVADDPPYPEDVGRIPPQGGPQAGG